ncbi:MAG: ACP S-malonyltransferase [Candidatus Omnitrophica bacterium]|nr:ACP S-malonyltransferase [Candidatus Omnitrophota bacterium]MDD5429806.1 ACP S-malonyltransferase [Candidatus Omnitrophota bacterium]
MSTKKAIIFPGQGSQYKGMGQSLYKEFSCCRDIFDSTDKILGFKLSKKCFEGQLYELKDTAIQQLAILTVSLAAFEVFKQKGISVDYLSGLSLGEYSCLYAAESLTLRDLVILVRERALAMQKAAALNSSTMFAVIGIDEENIRLCAQEGGFYIANINAGGQTVVSLAQSNKEAVRGLLQAHSARVIELDVSGGFHSPFMDSARENLEKVISGLDFKPAKIPIVSNVTAKPHTDVSEIRENLLKQLTMPVLWKACAEFMIDEGVETFYEVGPSKVLKGIMRKINSEIKVVNIEKREDLEGL